MFRVKIGNDRVVAFTFKHEHFDEPRYLSGSSAKVKSQTMCELEVDAFTYFEWAYCSIKDVFDKDKARKVSLAKAMKIAGLGKADRELVWDRYHARYLSNDEFEVWQEYGIMPERFVLDVDDLDIGDKPMQGSTPSV